MCTRWHVFLATTVLLGATLIANAQTLLWGGALPGGTWSETYGLSYDPFGVYGKALDAGGKLRAVRWTVPEMPEDLGTLGGSEGEVNAVSLLGAVAVGRSRNAAETWRAFRRTESEGMQDLGTLGGAESEARAVSWDGSVIVGSALNAEGRLRAFRWQSGVMQDLGTLGGTEGDARAVSADGSVVAGRSRNSAGTWRGCRWIGDTVEDLGTLGGSQSIAYAVSADGSVVVGRAHVPGNKWHAFRWAGGTIQDLGTLGGTESEAYSVSADGTIVVGRAQITGDSAWHAFFWTPSTGMQDLNVVFAGVLSPGSYLEVARFITPDGRYVMGRGYRAETGRTEAFLLDTMVTITGNVELRDFGGDVTQIPITVEVRPIGAVVLSLDSGGNYAFATYPGTYDLAFKASHWLRTVVSNVSVSGSVVTVNVSLTNGDIDGDNEVTLFDFGALVAAFGSTPTDSNWNPNADLDGDEEVTLFDFGVLVRNFGAIGDE